MSPVKLNKEHRFFERHLTNDLDSLSSYLVEKQEDKKRIPHTRVNFERYVMNIDLSQFNNVDLSKEDYKNKIKIEFIKKKKYYKTIIYDNKPARFYTITKLQYLNKLGD